MSVFSRSVWFPEFLHPIPVGPIHKEQLPLQHVCLPVEDVGVHQTSMVNQNPLEALHVNVTALQDSKEVLWPFLVKHQFKAKCYVFVTCTSYI